jgi:hypothetical protein
VAPPKEDLRRRAVDAGFLRPDLRPPNPGAAGGRGSPPGLAGDLSLAGLASAMSVKGFDQSTSVDEKLDSCEALQS